MVNYDTNNLYLAPYDWRLSFWNLEERDGYFSKLQSKIEGFKYDRPIERPIIFLTPCVQEATKEEDCPRRTLHGSIGSL